MGPLAGVRIVELAGIGPGPMAAMMLADLGATVLRVDRKVPVPLGTPRPLKFNLLLRNRQMIALDLKQPRSVELVLELIERADGLIEGFRPGVTERMGLGPDACLARNPRLVYGRMTGWGQNGPLAAAAGHDLNYIAVTGVLDAIGRADQPPSPPLNLVGDYAGGAAYLALGMLAGIMEARQSGRGQVVDAAIVDGTMALATSLFGMHAAGLQDERGHNTLDSGAPFYETYQCADGKWISIAPIEAKFFAEMCQRIGLAVADFGNPHDKRTWPTSKARFAQVFRTRTREQWRELLEGSDACFAPVLSLDEVAGHPHIAARQSLIEVDGVPQPAPAPRFSRSQAAMPRPPHAADPRTGRDALGDWLGDEAARWHSLVDAD